MNTRRMGKKWSSHIGTCKLCNINTYLHGRYLCWDCEELIPTYIPEIQWEKYYHEKIRST
jgi:hypothetical protein